MPHSDPAPPREAEADSLTIGVLASQGDFAAHAAVLRSLGAAVREVRCPADLGAIDGLVIPGGESTTIMKALARDELLEPIRAHVGAGRPVLGTCAGMIVLDRQHLGLMDTRARRNAFGRQLQSFETDLRIEGMGEEPLRAVFIRAPWIEESGEGVEVLATYDGHPVVVREGRLLACAFHPELTDDSRLHALFMGIVTAAREQEREQEVEGR
jgi:5'-phosphate synthase pdxT subunit